MKILFWTDGFWPRIGGIETQGLLFVEGMQERGHQYIVLAQKEGLDSKEDEVYKGIIIKRFDFNRTFSKVGLKNLTSIELYLQKIAKEFQPDIIHVNTSAGWCAFIFLLFKKVFHSSIVLTIHSHCFYENDETNPLIEKLP